MRRCKGSGIEQSRTESSRIQYRDHFKIVNATKLNHILFAVLFFHGLVLVSWVKPKSFWLKIWRTLGLFSKIFEKKLSYFYRYDANRALKNSILHQFFSISLKILVKAQRKQRGQKLDSKVKQKIDVKAKKSLQPVFVIYKIALSVRWLLCSTFMTKTLQ